LTRKYIPGDTAYIVESSFMVRKVQIRNISGEFCTLRFLDTNGGIKVRLSRLFHTQEAAEATLPSAKKRPPHPHLDEFRDAKNRDRRRYSNAL